MNPKKTYISQNGKYQSNSGQAASRRKKQQKEKILIVVLALIALLLIIAIGVMLLMVKEQKKFKSLSAMVQETEAKVTLTNPIETTELILSAADTEEMTESTTIPAATEPRMLEKYTALYEQNPDFYGWIKIEGTKIDYPVMYTPQEPEKYLHTDFDNQYSYSGVPFMEDTCTPDSDNMIIYGHNMANGTMFRDLIQYEKQSFWELHPQIQFDTLFEEQTFEVVAAFYDRVYYKSEDVFKFYQFIDAEDKLEFDNAVDQFRKKAIYDTGIIPEYGEQLITLVTCAYHTDNGRFVVVARRIPDAQNSGEMQQAQPMVQGLLEG